jgi:hypothetical protein
VSTWTVPAHQLQQEQARILAEALQHLNPDDPELARRYTTTLAGDERKLRGIPALGRGVGGAINGTRPGDRIGR